MIEIGRYNTLRVIKRVEQGLLLTAGKEEVFLPQVHIPKHIEMGDDLEAFVYVHKDGRLVATTQKAFGQVGDYVFLKVVDEAEDGVFLDLGIDKDVFVANRDMKRPMQKGQHYVVYLFLNDFNQRLQASSKLYDFVETENFEFEEGDAVELLLTEETDLGYNAIINNEYIGLLYFNEVFGEVEIGKARKGWIKKIRVEGKIDLTLQPSGYDHILDAKAEIFKALKKANGTLDVGDKTSPEEIHYRFQMSKNAFKKAIGALYKERLIRLGDHEISLISDEEYD